MFRTCSIESRQEMVPELNGSKIHGYLVREADSWNQKMTDSPHVSLAPQRFPVHQMRGQRLHTFDVRPYRGCSI